MQLILSARHATRYRRPNGTLAPFKELLLISRALDVSIESSFSSPLSPDHADMLTKLLSTALCDALLDEAGIKTLVQQIIDISHHATDLDVTDSAKQLVREELRAIKTLALMALAAQEARLATTPTEVAKEEARDAAMSRVTKTLATHHHDNIDSLDDVIAEKESIIYDQANVPYDPRAATDPSAAVAASSALREQCRHTTDLALLLARRLELLGVLDTTSKSKKSGSSAALLPVAQDAGAVERANQYRAADAAVTAAVASFARGVEETNHALAHASASELSARLMEQHERSLATISAEEGHLTEQERLLAREREQLMNRLGVIDRQLESIRAVKATTREKKERVTMDVVQKFREMHLEPPPSLVTSGNKSGKKKEDALAASGGALCEGQLERNRVRIDRAQSLQQVIRRAARTLAGDPIDPAPPSTQATSSSLDPTFVTESVSSLFNAIDASLQRRHLQQLDLTKSLEWCLDKLPKARDSAHRAATISQAAKDKMVKQVSDLEKKLQETMRVSEDVRAVVEIMLRPVRQLLSGSKLSMQLRATANRLLQGGEGIESGHQHAMSLAAQAMEEKKVNGHGVNPPIQVPASASMEDRLKEYERQLKLKEAAAAATNGGGAEVTRGNDKARGKKEGGGKKGPDAAKTGKPRGGSSASPAPPAAAKS